MLYMRRMQCLGVYWAIDDMVELVFIRAYEIKMPIQNVTLHTWTKKKNP